MLTCCVCICHCCYFYLNTKINLSLLNILITYVKYQFKKNLCLGKGGDSFFPYGALWLSVRVCRLRFGMIIQQNPCRCEPTLYWYVCYQYYLI